MAKAARAATKTQAAPIRAARTPSSRVSFARRFRRTGDPRFAGAGFFAVFLAAGIARAPCGELLGAAAGFTGFVFGRTGFTGEA
jgi:hypothetical protein